MTLHTSILTLRMLHETNTIIPAMHAVLSCALQAVTNDSHRTRLLMLVPRRSQRTTAPGKNFLCVQ